MQGKVLRCVAWKLFPVDIDTDAITGHEPTHVFAEAAGCVSHRTGCETRRAARKGCVFFRFGFWSWHREEVQSRNGAPLEGTPAKKDPMLQKECPTFASVWFLWFLFITSHLPSANAAGTLLTGRPLGSSAPLRAPSSPAARGLPAAPTASLGSSVLGRSAAPVPVPRYLETPRDLG